MSVLVVGSVALDNVRTPFGEVKEALGGSCSYASTSASYFSDVDIVGVVGSDFPDAHVKLLESRGIATKGLEHDNTGQTFRWRGYYEYDMNQAHTLETSLNVFANFQPKIPDVLRKQPFVMLGNIDPDLQLQVLNQVEKPTLTMVDTMNFWIEGKRDVLTQVFKQCDVVMLNDAEARQFCDTVSLQKAAHDLMKMGIGRVIIKKGEHGCLMFSREGFFSAPAFPLEVVKDPTGAGDTFAGGFIGFLAGAPTLDENTFRQAVIVGTVMASFTVEAFSLDRIAHLKREDIVHRCELLRRQIEFPPVQIGERIK